MIKPNVREFREMVGKGIKEESQIKAEAQKMVKNGRCELLVISLGAAGALAVAEEFAVAPLLPSFQFYEPVKIILLEDGAMANMSFEWAYLLLVGALAFYLSSLLLKKRWLMK